MNISTSILEYMTIASSLHDEYGNFIYANPVFCKLFKTTNKELVSNKFDTSLFTVNIDHGDDITNYININFKKIDNYTLKIVGDTNIWLKVNSIHVKNGNDYYLLTYEDVSDSISNNFLYEQIFNNIKSGIIVIKPFKKRFVVREMNPQAQSLFDRNIIDVDIDEIIKNDINNKKLSDYIRVVFKTGQTKELKSIHFSQNNKECWKNISIIKVETGEILVIIDDITENIINKNKLEKSNKMKSEFLSNMSHEIRSPINAIVGFSELLEKATDKEVINNHVNIIKNSSRSLMKLIDDILDMSKIEVGKLSIVKTSFSVNKLIDELFDLNFERVSDNVELKIDVPANVNGFKLYNDDLRIKQVFVNLLNNAMRYTDQGEITIGYEITSDFVVFFCKDTGAGIPEDNIHNIFDRYKQVKNKSRYGNGLGLSISKELVKLMGGDIWVNSKIGYGSEFYFKIPISKKMNIKQAKTEVDDGNYDFMDKKILIVEDIEFNTKLLCSYLEDTNATIILADNGSDALLKYNEHKDSLDLILMDIQIPDIDGIEVTQIIRTIDQKTPIIVQTAYALKEEIDDILQNGFNDLIKKPIKMSELLQMIKKYI